MERKQTVALRHSIALTLAFELKFGLRLGCAESIGGHLEEGAKSRGPRTVHNSEDRKSGTYWLCKTPAVRVEEWAVALLVEESGLFSQVASPGRVSTCRLCSDTMAIHIRLRRTPISIQHREKTRRISKSPE